MKGFMHFQNRTCMAKIMWACLQCLDKKVNVSSLFSSSPTLYLNKASVIKIYFQAVSGGTNPLSAVLTTSQLHRADKKSLIERRVRLCLFFNQIQRNRKKLNVFYVSKGTKSTLGYSCSMCIWAECFTAG